MAQMPTNADVRNRLGHADAPTNADVSRGTSQGSVRSALTNAEAAEMRRGARRGISQGSMRSSLTNSEAAELRRGLSQHSVRSTRGLSQQSVRSTKSSLEDNWQKGNQICAGSEGLERNA